MDKIDWAIKTLNNHVNKGMILRENLTKLECLIAIKYLEQGNLVGQLALNDEGKLHFKQ
jgi:hypothetical protein